MYGFPTMSPIFGIIFVLAGLALAVMLGLKLYPDKKTKASSSEKSYGYQDEGKTA
jgi:hypothetical protein